MKLKTHKSELKLNKTEKSEVKTTARKQFVKNTIKDGIKKTDDPMEKEMESRRSNKEKRHFLPYKKSYS